MIWVLVCFRQYNVMILRSTLWCRRYLCLRHWQTLLGSVQPYFDGLTIRIRIKSGCSQNEMRIFDSAMSVYLIFEPWQYKRYKYWNLGIRLQVWKPWEYKKFTSYFREYKLLKSGFGIILMLLLGKIITSNDALDGADPKQQINSKSNNLIPY